MPGHAVEESTLRRKAYAAAAALASVFALAAAAPAAEAAATAADLRLTVTAGQDGVTVGNRLTYLVTVRNTGTAGAQGVVLTLRLPKAVVPVLAAGETDRRCRGKRVLRCPLGALGIEPGEASQSVEIVLRAKQRGRFRATLRASLRGRDARPQDNERRLRLRVLAGKPAADLSASASLGVARVAAGIPFDYVVEVRNAGPTEATRVVVTTVLPGGMRDQGGGIAGAVRYAGCEHAAHAPIRCTIGALPAGETVRLTFRVVAGTAGDRRFVSTVTSSTPDRDHRDRRATASVAVDPPPAVADLGVAVHGPVQGAVVGTSLAFTVELTNAGPDVAREVRLGLFVGPPARLLSATPSRPAPCSGQQPTCLVGDLAPGETITFTLLVEPTAAGVFVVGAVGVSSTFDPSQFALGGLVNSAAIEVRAG